MRAIAAWVAPEPCVQRAAGDAAWPAQQLTRQQLKRRRATTEQRSSVDAASGMRRTGSLLRRLVCHDASFVMMIVPLAANMPPTPWQTEIFAPGTWAGAVPRIWRTLSCKAYMPYIPECM